MQAKSSSAAASVEASCSSRVRRSPSCRTPKSSKGSPDPCREAVALLPSARGARRLHAHADASPGAPDAHVRMGLCGRGPPTRGLAMTAPDPHAEPAITDSSSSSLVRAAIWVAIGALIAAAIVCVVWVLIGTQNGIIGRAFLTILLLAAFAGVAIIDAHLASRRPAWFALASMVTWVVTLLLGAVLIWLPERYSFGGFNRFIQFLLIVLILQLALLHVRLYTKAFRATSRRSPRPSHRHDHARRRPGRAAGHPADDRRVGRVPRLLLAHRGRDHDPRRRRHRSDPARERAVRTEEAAARVPGPLLRWHPRRSRGRRTPTASRRCR